VLREREREREGGREGGRQLEVAKNSTGTVKLKPEPAPKTIFCWVLSFSLTFSTVHVSLSLSVSS